ncbi:MAG: hypothetical protein QF704_16345, partial [Anaerolineales bacterium]|nr:hypothetical protein [Anaerolineales bacterium]
AKSARDRRKTNAAGVMTPMPRDMTVVLCVKRGTSTLHLLPPAIISVRMDILRKWRRGGVLSVMMLVRRVLGQVR